MIPLNSELIPKLSSKGVLAYVAVLMAGNSVATTATLASLVKAQTAPVLEGLKELAVEAPDAVKQNKKERTWTCGRGGDVGPILAMDGVVPIIGMDAALRFRDFVEDLKKFWDFLNPEVPFQFSGPDGVAVRTFLADHPKWTRTMWQEALQHRARSVKLFGNGSRTQAAVGWVRKLGDYAGGPLNQFNRPVEGMGNAGKAIAIEHCNNEAGAAYLAGHRAG